MLRLLRRPFFWVIALVIAIFAIAPSIGNNVELRESLILAAPSSGWAATSASGWWMRMAGRSASVCWSPAFA